jgi:uncharacterized protein YdaL
MIAELERAATANLAEVENAYVSQSELTNVSNKEILNLYDEKDAETDDRIRRHDTLFGLLNSTITNLGHYKVQHEDEISQN